MVLRAVSYLQFRILVVREFKKQRNQKSDRDDLITFNFQKNV